MAPRRRKKASKVRAPARSAKARPESKVSRRVGARKARATPVVKAAGEARKRSGAPRRKAAPAARRAAPRRAGGGSGRRAGSARRRRPGRAPLDLGRDPEGYFIARVRGEEAVRAAPHALTEADEPEDAATAPTEEAPAGDDEGSGELPGSYGEDAFLGLARDPRTLFFYWDHSREELRRASEGLERPRAQLRLFAREAEGRYRSVRRVDIALESRGHYAHELEPGGVYRAEIHLVDRSGRERRLGPPSGDVALPPAGPSPLVDDLLARIPAELPLGRGGREVRRGGGFPDELRELLARLSDGPRSPGEGAPAGEAGGSSSPAAGAGEGGRGPGKGGA
ncbi:MAG TPA: DUF4912 domain-containing protein [Anaeromyxobacteraceae bacterium]|nr:DUF4912 domain-containing protein [Anaeromyxobacteraceae bacterium]